MLVKHYLSTTTNLFIHDWFAYNIQSVKNLRSIISFLSLVYHIVTVNMLVTDSLFITLHFILVTYKYTWRGKQLSLLYKSLPSLFAHNSLCTQIVAKILFKVHCSLNNLNLPSLLLSNDLFQDLPDPEKNYLV